MTSKSIKGKSAKAFLAVVVAAGFAALHVVWAFTILIVTFCVAVLTWYWGRAAPIKKAILWAILLAVASLLYLAGNTSKENPGSASRSRVPGAEFLLTEVTQTRIDADAAPSNIQASTALEEFRERALELRKQGNAVERALILQRHARPIESTSGRSEADRQNIFDAMKELDAALGSAKLTTLDAVKTKKASLSDFIVSWERKAAKITDATAARELLIDFELQSKEQSLDGIARETRKLENALNQLYHQVVDKEVGFDSKRLVSLRYKEGEAKESPNIFIEDSISIQLKEPAIKAVDASELLLDRFPNARHEDVCLILNPKMADRCEKMEDPRHILVPSNVTSLTIMRTTAMREKVEVSDWPFRWLKFSTLYFRAPPAKPVRVNIVMDLSAHQGPKEYPYSFDVIGGSDIPTIRIPAYSYFGSGYNVTDRHERDEQILTPAESLSADYFLKHRFMWIDFIPQGMIFRNEFVYDKRRLFFSENWLMASIVGAIGAILGMALGKKD